MPIPSRIEHAAGAFRQNERMLAKSYDGLTQDEWHRRPSESSNNMLWIAGHLVWARSRAVASLGSSWNRPWLSLSLVAPSRLRPSNIPRLMRCWRHGRK